MPHDCMNRVVNDGDTVTLTARVSEVTAGETDCNCRFTVMAPPGCDEKFLPSFVGNTRLACVQTASDTCAPSPPIAHVLQFFSYSHLPPRLQAISKPFADLANLVVGTSSNQETTVALRKLLEAKDAAVRALLAK